MDAIDQVTGSRDGVVMTVSFRRRLTTGASAEYDVDLSGCPSVYLLFAIGPVNEVSGRVEEHAGNGEPGGAL